MLSFTMLYSAAWCLLFVLGSTSVPASESWQAVGWGGGGFYWSVAFHPKRDGVVYMGGDVAGVYKSVDHGLTWKLADSAIAGYEVLSIATDAEQQERVYAVTTNGISRSEDGAAHWTLLPVSAPGRLQLVCEKFKSVHCLAVAPRDSKRLAFAAPDGRVLESRDFGSTWRVLTKVASGFASSVAFNPGSGALFAATSRGLLQFGHGGAPGDAVPGHAYAVVFDSSGKVGYAAMGDQGIWRSADSGATWERTALQAKAGEQWLDVVVDLHDARRVHAIEASDWAASTAVAQGSAEGILVGTFTTHWTPGDPNNIPNPADCGQQ